MKWIGQHIWDFISRFRTTVYIENLETSSEENVLVVDSDGKVTKNTTLGGSNLTITDAADNRIVTSSGGSALLAETYASFVNTGNTSTLILYSNENAADYVSIATTTNGATKIQTVDADAALANLTLYADGNIYAKIPDQLEFSIANTDGSGGTSHKFTSEVGAESHFYMYPSGGGVTADYFHIEVGQDGGTTLRTTDGVGASADLTLSADGRFQVDTADVDLYMGNYTSQEAGDVSFRSSTTFKPQLILESNANDNKPPSIKFLKDKGAAGADNDYVGTIHFSGDNSAQEETEFAHIRGRIGSAGDTDEAGKLYIGVAASNGSSSNIRDAIVLTGDPLGDIVDVELGYGDGDVEFKRRKFTKTADATHFDVQGDILYLGGGSTTQGDLCYLKEDGEWGQADADGAATGDDADRDAMGMLAIALGTDPDAHGMLIKGIITMDYDLGDCGNPIYVSTTAGDMTNAAPTASGDFVRVVGYCLDDTNGQIYFNPDNTWVEIA